MPELERVSRNKPVRSVKRAASASPATGSPEAHKMEQKTLMALAFTTRGG
jgi:2-oxoglutarate dehydrogenase complex dehydrogenase (E1) component-like enzyme